MISEERLKEICNSKGSIWAFNGYFNEYIEIPIDNSCFDIYKNCLDIIYDNKEDADFCNKYHCNKIIWFKPPTFEEFEKSTGELNNEYPHYETDRLCIMDCFSANEIQVFTYPENDYGRPRFEYKENIESKKQAYYQAVEYAKKLFLGEEE